MKNFFSIQTDVLSSYIIDQILLDESDKIIFINFRIKNPLNTYFMSNIFDSYKKNFFFLSINREKILDFDKMFELFFFSENILFLQKNFQT